MAFNEEMEKKIEIKGRKLQGKRVIMQYCHKIANELLNEEELVNDSMDNL